MQRSEEPLKKITIRVFESDEKELMVFYPHHGARSEVYRVLLRRHIRRIKEAERKRQSSKLSTFDTDGLLSEEN